MFGIRDRIEAEVHGLVGFGEGRVARWAMRDGSAARARGRVSA